MRSSSSGARRSLLLSQFRSGAIASLCARAVSIGCRLVSIPLTLSIVDVGQYGIWLTVSNLVTWMSVAEGGLPSALQNCIAELIAKGDRRTASEVVNSAVQRMLFTGCVVAAVGLVALLLLPLDVWFHISQDNREAFRMAFGAALITSAMLFVGRLGPSLAYAHGKSSWPPLFEILGQVSALLCLVAARTAHLRDLRVLIVAGFAAGALSQIFLLAAVLVAERYHLTAIRWGDRSQSTTKVAGQRSFQVNLMAEGLVSQGFPLAVALGGGAQLVALYSVPQVFFNGFIMLQAAVLRPLWPALHGMFRGGQPSEPLKLVRGVLIASIAAAACISVCILTCGNLLLSALTRNSIPLSQVMAYGCALHILVAAVDHVLAYVSYAANVVFPRCVFYLAYGVIGCAALFFITRYGSVDYAPLILGLVMTPASLVPSALVLIKRFSLFRR